MTGTWTRGKRKFGLPSLPRILTSWLQCSTYCAMPFEHLEVPSLKMTMRASTSTTPRMVR